MVTITISKKITNGRELIVVPKKDWEELLKIAKKKIHQIEIEKGLKKALREVRSGKLIGPFENASDLIKSLEKK